MRMNLKALSTLSVVCEMLDRCPGIQMGKMKILYLATVPQPAGVVWER